MPQSGLGYKCLTRVFLNDTKFYNLTEPFCSVLNRPKEYT